jgi:eukaryotic-like serine/threonine-protein kinase
LNAALWRRVNELFQAALALDLPERAAYLNAAAGDDPVALAHVHILLEHDRAAAEEWPDLALAAVQDDAGGSPFDLGGDHPRMSVSLRVVDGPHKDALFTFGEHDTFIVGRSPSAHFCLPHKDKTLSRYQFLIEINPPSCRLMDMASTNGTRVNGRRRTTADLKDGDIITGGRTNFAVSLESAEAGRSERQEDGLHSRDLLALHTEGDAIPDVAGYHLEECIGKGGMGVVFKARDARGTPFAIKMITPAALGSSHALARFLREASILRNLDHPNIVRFHAIGETGGRLYFVMELVNGSDAAGLVKARAPLSPGEAVGIIYPILDALDYAHRAGYVHRDVKPTNILLEDRGNQLTAKLADFGLARIYQNSSLSGLTITGHVAGTLGFMPPEQITDFRDAKPASDQYSAGATLYYLLTGAMVYDLPGTPHGQIMMILTKDPLPIRERRPDVPDELGAVIKRSMARKPEDRFPSIAAMRDALARFATAP